MGVATISLFPNPVPLVLIPLGESASPAGLIWNYTHLFCPR